MLYAPTDVLIGKKFITIGATSFRISAIDCIELQSFIGEKTIDLVLRINTSKKYVFTFRSIGNVYDMILDAVQT